MHPRSVVSDAVTCGLQPSRLLCPRDSPGKSTGVGCHVLLQGIFPIQRSTGVSYASCIGRWVLHHWCHLGSPLYWALLNANTSLVWERAEPSPSPAPPCASLCGNCRPHEHHVKMLPKALLPVKGLGPFRKQLRENSLTNDSLRKRKGEDVGVRCTQIW